jgi:hypothetical protein
VNGNDGTGTLLVAVAVAFVLIKAEISIRTWVDAQFNRIGGLGSVFVAITGDQERDGDIGVVLAHLDDAATVAECQTVTTSTSRPLCAIGRMLFLKPPWPPGGEPHR